MAKGTAGKNYWALLLMILAGVVLGGFIGQLSAGVPALRPWAPRHIPASTAPESRCAQPPGGPQAGPVFLRQRVGDDLPKPHLSGNSGTAATVSYTHLTLPTTERV